MASSHDYCFASHWRIDCNRWRLGSSSVCLYAVLNESTQSHARKRIRNHPHTLCGVGSIVFCNQETTRLLSYTKCAARFNWNVLQLYHLKNFVGVVESRRADGRGDEQSNSLCRVLCFPFSHCFTISFIQAR